VAKQLFKAVDFMHQLGVAHMDLKPENILIPPKGDHLFIIDFSISLRVKGVDDVSCGVIGTSGYILPEVVVYYGFYSAIYAYLWSCGKTLQ
ncbi:kinase-like protein, partial [Rhizopogon salebrosus TDB-379]